MAIKYYADLIQGSDAWLAARRGILTASEMKLIITPTMKPASNEKERTHLYELLAQRITGYVEPFYVSDDMLRGHADEVTARIHYSETYAPVDDMGFIVNDKWGFPIGYSPDGMVGTDGLIECKSRRQKYQIQTILESFGEETAPAEYMIQLQTGLLVSERAWIDFISFSGGLPMATTRVYPDRVLQAAIVDVASGFEARLAKARAVYDARTANPLARLIPTERTVEQEITA